MGPPVEGNKIKNLPENFGSNTLCYCLKYLNLSNNEISSLPVYKDLLPLFFSYLSGLSAHNKKPGLFGVAWELHSSLATWAPPSYHGDATLKFL